LLADGEPAAEATVLLATEAGGPAGAADGRPRAGGAAWAAPADTGGSAAAYAWLGRLLAVGAWEAVAEGGWRAEVTPVRASEWFAMVDPPRPALPVAAIEAAAAVSPTRPGAEPAPVWRADRLTLAGAGAEEPVALWLPAPDVARFAGPEPDAPAPELHGFRWELPAR
ncbi:hypothetical protein EBN88_26280, partial [Streptomyces triticirhizae]